MTLDELRRLDPKQIGSWPILPKLGVLLLVLIVIIGLSYWLDWDDQLGRIDSEEKKEIQLKASFIEKKKVAINLDAYRKQLDDIQKQFGTLLKQLPGKSEMDALLTDINQAGLGRGLQFELFKPGAEAVREFYAELPITIRISGSYHDMGAFASDIGKLSRIVTINDIAIAPVGKGGLVMDATARTYRYLDDEEVSQRRKAAVKGKGKGKAAPVKK